MTLYVLTRVATPDGKVGAMITLDCRIRPQLSVMSVMIFCDRQQSGRSKALLITLALLLSVCILLHFWEPEARYQKWRSQKIPSFSS